MVVENIGFPLSILSPSCRIIRQPMGVLRAAGVIIPKSHLPRSLGAVTLQIKVGLHRMLARGNYGQNWDENSNYFTQVTVPVLLANAPAMSL